MKTIALLVIVVGVGLFSLGAWMWWEDSAPAPSVHLVESTLNVGIMELDRKIEIAIRVSNTSSQPQRLVGILDEPC